MGWGIEYHSISEDLLQTDDQFLGLDSRDLGKWSFPYAFDIGESVFSLASIIDMI